MIPLESINDSNSLGTARISLRAVINEGATCPLCLQHVQMYKRNISSSSAKALCLIVRFKQVGEYFHLEDFLKTHAPDSKTRGDVAKLTYWGFLIRKEGKAEDGNPSQGMYKLTMAGSKFVRDPKTETPKYIQLYNNDSYGFLPDAYVTITQCLRNRFNYDQLMKGTL